MHVVPSSPHYMSFLAMWVHFCACTCALSHVYLMSTLDVMLYMVAMCAYTTCVCSLPEFIYMCTHKPHTLTPSPLTTLPSPYILILTSPHTLTPSHSHNLTLTHTLTPSSSQWRYQLHHNRDWSQLGTTATPPALHGGCSEGGEKEETNCQPKYELHPVRGQHGTRILQTKFVFFTKHCNVIIFSVYNLHQFSWGVSLLREGKSQGLC